MESPPTEANGGDFFAARLLDWFDAHGRHDLPWMHPRTPYRTWLSEIMLQQTQVATVIPYFLRFVTALPELPTLAVTAPDEVLALWSGLGYYSRARNLHAAAKCCMAAHGGDLPRDFTALLALPGIGRSTAGAILAQAWGERFPILDGNVKRVLTRLYGIDGWPTAPAVEKRLWALAEAALPSSPATRPRMADYTQAQMDLGATVCTRARPRCDECPFTDTCVAKRESRTSELPTSRPKKIIPQRETRMLWLRDIEGRTLLARRPTSGIWASLWSLPEADDQDGIDRLVARHAHASEMPRGEALPPIEHAFTHFRLRIRPWRLDGIAPRARVGDNDDLRWVAPEAFAALGIPAPVRKLIEENTP
ncbi:A/G-specific adenine glycosylase [Lysobacter pythonis]|uniref:Adenine DNA glycosylase n=1 Tax=Solilutibacter pythonis TaxID=2483112 RepID=A0A3M2HXV4_9GAMM|nr:A/G-specific adenine glycosylase [Lysobacter pythonis]RMH94561.1 A/G-specific adenine glycosylase [Lysobacter pythonis]